MLRYRYVIISPTDLIDLRELEEDASCKCTIN